jgi:hypothetical protein
MSVTALFVLLFVSVFVVGCSSTLEPDEKSLTKPTFNHAIQIPSLKVETTIPDTWEKVDPTKDNPKAFKAIINSPYKNNFSIFRDTRGKDTGIRYIIMIAPEGTTFERLERSCLEENLAAKESDAPNSEVNFVQTKIAGANAVIANFKNTNIQNHNFEKVPMLNIGSTWLLTNRYIMVYQMVATKPISEKTLPVFFEVLQTAANNTVFDQSLLRNIKPPPQLRSERLKQSLENDFKATTPEAKAATGNAASKEDLPQFLPNGTTPERAAPNTNKK